VNRFGNELVRFLRAAYNDTAFTVFFVILAAKLVIFVVITDTGMESFFPSAGTILIFMAPSLLLENERLKFLSLYLLDFAFSVLFVSQALYIKYFDDFASVYSLAQAHQVWAILDMIKGMVGAEILFVVDLVFPPVLFLGMRAKYSYTFAEKMRLFLLLCAAGLCLNFNPLTYSIRKHDNFFKSFMYRRVFVEHMGVINFQAFDIYSYLRTKIGKALVTQSDVDTVTNWVRGWEMRNTKNSLTGTGKGRNLIFIQVESLQNFVIGKKYNGHEITPVMNKLAREGIYFRNIFDQTAAGNSSDAEFLANASLYPASRGAVSFLYPENSFDSLPKILRSYGYSTTSMLAYTKQFWNFSVFDKGMGFERRFYEGDFIMTEGIGWGLSDKEFFRQSIDKIRTLPAPFYVLLRTLSTHAAFAYVTEKHDHFPLGALATDAIGYYMRSMHYVDSAIGLFLNKLSENNLLSNSVIVIYGDHRARLPQRELMKIRVNDFQENRKIPLIISLPGRKAGVLSSTFGGLIDVAPTVCNILGVDLSDKFFLGKDLGNGGIGYVIFRDGSYLPGGGSVNGRFAERQLMISDLVLEKDMIPLVKGSARRGP
jgi:lipoteichoic acid synthase